MRPSVVASNNRLSAGYGHSPLPFRQDSDPPPFLPSFFQGSMSRRYISDTIPPFPQAASTPSSLLFPQRKASHTTGVSVSTPDKGSYHPHPSHSQAASLMCIPSPQKNMTLEELARFRTHICPRKSANNVCALDEHCPYSHCLSWHRRNPLHSSYRPALCPNVIFNIGSDRKMRVKNYCKRGRLCLYSHTKEEQMYHPLVYKTQICRDYPSCRKHYCPFAHGEEEIRDANTLQLELAAMQRRQQRGTETDIHHPSINKVTNITVTRSGSTRNRNGVGGSTRRPQQPQQYRTAPHNTFAVVPTHDEHNLNDSFLAASSFSSQYDCSAEWPAYIEAALEFAAASAAATSSETASGSHSPNLRRCGSDINQLQHERARPITSHSSNDAHTNAALLVEMILNHDNDKNDTRNTASNDQGSGCTEHENESHLMSSTVAPDLPPPRCHSRQRGDTPLLLPAMPPPLYGHDMHKLLQMGHDGWRSQEDSTGACAVSTPSSLNRNDEDEGDKSNLEDAYYTETSPFRTRKESSMLSCCENDHFGAEGGGTFNNSSATSTTTVGSSSEWTKSSRNYLQAPYPETQPEVPTYERFMGTAATHRGEGDRGGAAAAASASFSLCCCKNLSVLNKKGGVQSDVCRLAENTFEELTAACGVRKLDPHQGGMRRQPHRNRGNGSRFVRRTATTISSVPQNRIGEDTVGAGSNIAGNSSSVPGESTGVLPYSLSTVTLAGSDCSKSTDASVRRTHSGQDGSSGSKRSSSDTSSPLSPTTAESNSNTIKLVDLHDARAMETPPNIAATRGPGGYSDNEEKEQQTQTQGGDTFVETQHDDNALAFSNRPRRVLLFDHKDESGMGRLNQRGRSWNSEYPDNVGATFEPEVIQFDTTFFGASAPTLSHSSNNNDAYMLAAAAVAGVHQQAAAALLFPKATCVDNYHENSKQSGQSQNGTYKSEGLTDGCFPRLAFEGNRELQQLSTSFLKKGGREYQGVARD